MSATMTAGTDRWVVKFHCRDDAGFDPEAHVPVFHRWIQQHRLPLVLIDVADYAHVDDGPGVLLVSHEYNIYADRFGGRAGLTVQRKLRGGVGTASLVETLRVALQAVETLSKEASLPASRFRVDEVEVVANDRLRAPNDDTGWRSIEPLLREVAARLYGEGASIERVANAAGQRLTASLRGNGDDATALLARL